MRNTIVTAAYIGVLIGACAILSALAFHHTQDAPAQLERYVQQGKFADCETDEDITSRAAELGLDIAQLHECGIMPF